MSTPDVQAMLDATAICRTLGAKFVSFNSEQPRLELHYHVDDTLTNPAGQVQGGILSSMLDDVTSILASLCAPGLQVSTLTLTTNYLNGSRPGQFLAVAEFDKQGRSVVNLRGTLYQGDRPIATATAVTLMRAPKAA